MNEKESISVPQQYVRQPLMGKKREAYDALTKTGRYETGQYLFWAVEPKVYVRDMRTGLLVAYSEAKSDYKDACEEFVRDFVR